MIITHRVRPQNKLKDQRSWLSQMVTWYTWYTCIVTAVDQTPETHILKYPVMVNGDTLISSADPNFDTLLIALKTVIAT